MDELILKEREIKERLVEIINESGLPAFILKPMIRDLFEQLSNLEEHQYQEAKLNAQIKEKKESE